MFPKKVMEGSSVTVTCDRGFRVEGDWLLRCHEGTLNVDPAGVFPKCAQLHNGKVLMI